jgi:hypothetical protein
VGPRTGLFDLKEIRISPLPELELRPHGRASRSQSLCRLLYPGALISGKEAEKSSKPEAERIFSYLFQAYGVRFQTVKARTSDPRLVNFLWRKWSVNLKGGVYVTGLYPYISYVPSNVLTKTYFDTLLFGID